mgnify:CR=1 FL=1
MEKKIIKIFTATIICLFLSSTTLLACKCPITAGDHVAKNQWSSISTANETDEEIMKRVGYWHCGDVESISGECGKWMVSIKTCDGKRTKCYYSYLKVLDSQKKNKSNLGVYTDSSKDFIPSDRR